MTDNIEKPAHYTSHPSGYECIAATRYMDFLTGNAFKYVFRAGVKSPDPTDDLKKARFYVRCGLTAAPRYAAAVAESIARAETRPGYETLLRAISVGDQTTALACLDRLISEVCGAQD